MSVEKPKTWLQTSIGSLCNLINGRAFKPKEWSEAGLPIIRIQNLNNPNAKYNYFDDDLADKHRIENGDLLFAWSGTPGTSFGAHVWKGETAALNQHIFKIEFIEALIDKHFLRYAINQTLDELISGAHGGVGLRHVTKGKFEATEIAFPPLLEQKVIADKLDTLLAQVENTKARLERVPKILKRFRQSVLAAAVSGRLTEEWRKEVNLPDWSDVRLDKICDSISDGDHQAPPRAQNGIPFLVISNVTGGGIDFDSVSRWVPEDYYNSLKSIRKPSRNDLLYTVTGSFGIPVVVNTEQSFCFQRHIAIIKPNHNVVSTRYLAFYLQSPKAFAHAGSVATGTAQKTVSLTNLRKFPINLPTMDEQTEIVRRVDQLFANADRIEQQVSNALARVNNLTQSILAKAFRGELTEQWRKDNPELISGENSAEALPERIKAERAAVKPAKKTRKRAKS